MNKRPTAGSFREPLTAPLQEVSASNFADTSARTSLRRAIQRAEEIYKKEGKDKLLGYLAEKKLTGYAGFIKTHESEECYEFSKSKPRLFHKDEYYKEREIYAHKMAFSDEKTGQRPSESSTVFIHSLRFSMYNFHQNMRIP